MFISNKYYRLYINLCQAHNDHDVYCETHHIIPKSMGGDDDLGNLVRLTPKQHYMAHRLLTKITEGDNLIKMKYALYMFCIDQPKQLNRYSVPSRIIAEARKVLKLKTESHRKNISTALKNHVRSDEHRRKLNEAVSNSNRTRDISKWRHKLGSMTGATRPEHSEFMKQKMKELKADLNIYTFVRNDIIFKGTRDELIRSYPEDNINNSELGAMIKGRYKRHRGWSLDTY